MRTDNLFDFLFGFHYKSYYQGKKTECQGFFDFIDFFFTIRRRTQKKKFPV